MFQTPLEPEPPSRRAIAALCRGFAEELGKRGLHDHVSRLEVTIFSEEDDRLSKAAASAISRRPAFDPRLDVIFGGARRAGSGALAHLQALDRSGLVLARQSGASSVGGGELHV